MQNQVVLILLDLIKVSQFIDPKIYEEEWFLFSPLFPTKTIQIKGADLKKAFENCENKVTEVTFNSQI